MKRQILSEEVDQIISQSFWGKGGVKLTESQQEAAKDQATPEAEVASDEQIEESAEKHVCPLCESHLEKPISDEKLAEHVNFMVDMISEVEGITEEEIQEAVDADEDSEEEDGEEDGEDESSND